MASGRQHSGDASRRHFRFLPLLAVVALLAGVPAIAPAAAAAPSPKPADKLPALASEPRPKPLAVVPPGDASNPPPHPDQRPDSPSAPRDHFDPARSVAVDAETTATQQVFDNPDGSRTARVSTRPVRFRDGAGVWRDIDRALVTRSDGTFGPKAAPEAATIASRADGSARLATPAGTISLDHEEAAPSPARIAGATATFARALGEGRDLALAVVEGGLEETVTLAGPTASPTYTDTFGLPPGVTARDGADGDVEFVDRGGAVVAHFGQGLAYDDAIFRGGPPASAPVSIRLVSQADGVARVAVGVDPAWVAAKDRTFPVHIDPFLVTYADASGALDTWVYSGEYANTAFSTHPNLVVGTPDSGAHVTRSLIKFDLSGVLAAANGYQVLGAALNVFNGHSYGGSCTPRAVNVSGLASAPSASTTWANQPAVDSSGVVSSTPFAHHTAAGSACPGAYQTLDVTSLAARWLRGAPNNGLQLAAASEIDPTFYKLFDAVEHADASLPILSINYDRLPAASTPLSPANGAVLGSPATTLTATTATDPDGDPVKYWFRATASPDAETGARAVDSGWLATPTYPVPAGALADGSTYYWHVITWDGVAVAPVPTVTFGPVASLRVDTHMGSPAATATDTVGPVAVDLPSGNAVVAHASPPVATVGGPMGLSYVYNSAASASGGLAGAYYADDGSHDFAGKTPAMVRSDPMVDFYWGNASPAAAIDADNFMVRWSGSFTPPRGGIDYTFSTSHDDGVRIKVNGVMVVDSWADQSINEPTACTTNSCGTIHLPTANSVPIEIDYYEHTGAAFVTVGIGGAFGPANSVISSYLQPEWLSSDPPALPIGWTLAPTDTYIAARMAEGGATLWDATSAAHRWRATANGFSPPPGEQGSARADATGAMTVHQDGTEHVFDAAGRIASATTTADDGGVTSVAYGWSGTPSRLRTLTDPVSGRVVTISYSGDAACPSPAPAGFDAAAPGGMACAVSYPDATSTKIWYVAKQLARIEDPGGAIVDFAYAGGLLTKVRDPLAADAVAAGVAPNDDTTRTLLAYDAGRVSSVTLAAPTPGALRPAHSYQRPSVGEVEVDVAGLDPAATGYARKVGFDAAGRPVTERDALGRLTTTLWDGDPSGGAAVPARPLSVTDAAGRMTTTRYDAAGRPTDAYGPAPSSCYGADRLPNGTCAPVAHSSVVYDGTIAGLAATYWATAAPRGVPALHRTGVGHPSGSLASTGTFPPAPLVAPWSARFDGQITLAAASNLQVTGPPSWGSATLWVDEVEVTGPTVSIAAGTHRLSIDYAPGSAPSIELQSRPHGSASFVTTPGSVLRPGYGLVTRATVDDSGGATPPMVTDTAYGPSPDPATALPTATVVDPDGAALATSFTYEPSGSNQHLRLLSRTLPAGNATTYAYYGDTATPATNPCVAASVSQAGLARLRTDPDPDGAGPQTAKVTESVYDAWGRVAGTRVGAEAWSCVTRDARGRPTARTVAGPPSRTVSYNYAVGVLPANPLVTSVADPAGTITTTSDLLGRVVSYTDVWNKTTTSTYDQAGRLTDTSGPAGAVRTVYDAAGRVDIQSLDGARMADAAYDGAGELATVSYATVLNGGNGTSLSAVTRHPTGMTTGLTWSGPGATLARDQVTRSQSGRVVDEAIDGVDANATNPNFVYDAAGRLTKARVAGHVYDYGFTTSGGCGPQAAPGRNSNRSSVTDNGGAPTTYCYDHADRLVSSSDAAVGTPAYDSHGNTTTLGTQTLIYDGADRHMETKVNGATVVRYGRDATGRIISRTEGTTTTRYGFAGAGDSPSFVMNAQGSVIERSLALVGGVLVTKRGGLLGAGDVWSYPNVHGDVMATADHLGVKQGATKTYDPYGQALGDLPDNSAGNFDYGWLGQHQRPLEHAGGLATIEMGARQYVPSIGRFLQVDPVEGGSANDYDYAEGDPVNGLDLTGEISIRKLKKKALAWKPLSKRCEGASYQDGISDACSRYRLAKVTGRPELLTAPDPMKALNHFDGDIISRNVKDFNPYQCAADFGSAVTSGGDLARIGKVVRTAKYAPGPAKAAVLGAAAGYSLYSVVNSGRKALSSCT